MVTDRRAQQYVLQQYELYNFTITSSEQCLTCLIIVLPNKREIRDRHFIFYSPMLRNHIFFAWSPEWSLSAGLTVYHVVFWKAWYFGNRNCSVGTIPKKCSWACWFMKAGDGYVYISIFVCVCLWAGSQQVKDEFWTCREWSPLEYHFGLWV